MSGMQVEIIRPKTKFGFVPEYDAQSGILEVTTTNREPWKYGIDVDGRIIIDIDQAGLLSNLDLIVPVSYWDNVSHIVPPTNFLEGDIRFAEDALSFKSFSIEFNVFYAKPQNLISIIIGKYTGEKQCVALSNKFFIISTNGMLSQFLCYLK